MPLVASGIGVAIPVGLMLWFNARTTGAPLLFGYEALWGKGHELGFHAAPWGIAHTPARGIELVSLYFLRLQTYLFETPVPSLVGMYRRALAGAAAAPNGWCVARGFGAARRCCTSRTGTMASISALGSSCVFCQCSHSGRRDSFRSGGLAGAVARPIAIVVATAVASVRHCARAFHPTARTRVSRWAEDHALGCGSSRSRGRCARCDRVRARELGCAVDGSPVGARTFRMPKRRRCIVSSTRARSSDGIDSLERTGVRGAAARAAASTTARRLAARRAVSLLGRFDGARAPGLVVWPALRAPAAGGSRGLHGLSSVPRRRRRACRVRSRSSRSRFGPRCSLSVALGLSGAPAIGQ